LKTQVKEVAFGYRKTVKRNHILTVNVAKGKAGKKRVATAGALRFGLIKREAVYGMQP